jgi:2-oxoglutarate ferredoxin oxidoreductase subunit alpha
MPHNLGEILGGFKRILVPELNMGQLVTLLRSRYYGPQVYIPFPKVQGRPFTIREVVNKIESLLA